MSALSFICVCSIMVAQFFGLGVSTLVQTSPKKKELQTLLPVLVELPLCLFLYGVTFACYLLSLGMKGETPSDIGVVMVPAGMVMAVFMVYMGAAYKNLILSVLAFVVVFLGIIFVTALPMVTDWLQGLSLWAAVGIGAAELLLGALLQYLTSLAVYRLPLSRSAFDVQLRKYL